MHLYRQLSRTNGRGRGETSSRGDNNPYPGEPVNGGLAGAVRGVVVEREERSRAGRTDDLAALTARDHPPGALLGHDEGCPYIDLRKNTVKDGHLKLSTLQEPLNSRRCFTQNVARTF